MIKRTFIGIFFLSLVSMFEVSAQDAFPPCMKESIPDQPFSLSIAVDPTIITAQDSINITYRLKNISERSVSACMTQNAEYDLRYDSGESYAIVNVSPHLGCSLEDIFIIPPATTLEWTRKITVQGESVGKAKIIGRLHSETKCYWSGVVESQPVQVNIINQ